MRRRVPPVPRGRILPHARVVLDRDGDVLPDPQSARGPVVANVPFVALGLVDADVGHVLLWLRCDLVERLHAELRFSRRPRLALAGPRAVLPVGGSLAPGAVHGVVAVCLPPRATGPALEGREDVTEKGPDERQVSDEHRDRRFSEVPVHVDVGNERGDKAVDLGKDRGNNDEDSHSKEKDKDQLLLERQANRHEKWNRDE